MAKSLIFAVLRKLLSISVSIETEATFLLFNWDWLPRDRLFDECIMLIRDAPHT